MTDLAQQIDALQSAIASGSKRVRYADREVEYRSLEEMQSTLRSLRKQQNAGRRAGRAYYVTRNGAR